jgi:hypothetical protein
MKPPTFRHTKSTIKTDPFESVIPDLQQNAARDGSPDAQQPPRLLFAQVQEQKIPKPQRRIKITVHLRSDLVERVKNAAYWNPRLTIASIAEIGILYALEHVEKEHGGPYPAREQELRGGRPIR